MFKKLAILGAAAAFLGLSLGTSSLAGADETLFDTMDEDEFQRRFGASALERPGLAGMRRNVRAAVGSLHRQERGV